MCEKEMLNDARLAFTIKLFVVPFLHSDSLPEKFKMGGYSFFLFFVKTYYLKPA